MRRLVLITTLVMSCIINCNAKEATFPDLSKAFPTAKLFPQPKTKITERYLYATDLPIADLEKTLLKFLGEGWGKHKFDDADLATVEKINEAFPGMESRIFVSQKHPTLTIHLTQCKVAFEGKKSMVIIAVTKK